MPLFLKMEYRVVTKLVQKILQLWFFSFSWTNSVFKFFESSQREVLGRKGKCSFRKKKRPHVKLKLVENFFKNKLLFLVFSTRLYNLLYNKLAPEKKTHLDCYKSISIQGEVYLFLFSWKNEILWIFCPPTLKKSSFFEKK